MPDENVVEEKTQMQYTRSEDFRSRYANNVFYETSVFDIKTTFGEILQKPGQVGVAGIEQHTAVTMSWLEAKLAAIFMALNVASHEKKFGVIAIPSGVLPPTFEGDEAELPITELLKLVENRPPLKEVAAADAVEVTQ